MAYIAKLSNSGGVKSLNRYVSALAGNTAFVPSSYESIATITVGAGGASAVTFTSIPQTYQHLQIRFIGRTVASDTAENAWIRFNGDAGNNYSFHYVEGDGSGTNAGGAGSFSRLLAGRLAAGNSGTNVFGASVIDILDYTNSNKNTTARTFGGIDRNGSGNLRLDSGAWFNTAAVTSIDISNGNGLNYSQYSTFALYGIKGA